MSHDNPNSDWKIDDPPVRSVSLGSEFLSDSNGNTYPIYNLGNSRPQEYHIGIDTTKYDDRTVVQTVYTGGSAWDQLTQQQQLIKQPIYTMGNNEPRSFTHVNYTTAPSKIAHVDVVAYLKLLNNIAIVHKAYVIYQDLPNEISVRVEMLMNTKDVDGTIIDDAQQDLNAIFTNYRIKDCQQINMSIIYNEVII
jgi:hypothetical protein